MEASLVDPQSFESVPVRKVVHRLLDRLKDRALELGCLSQLQIVRELADRPTGSVLQLEAYRQTGDLPEVIRRMLMLSHLADNPATT
jgi:gamma-glutamyl:cysteine ligase YbdK (ATP-grasp superfamily)